MNNLNTTQTQQQKEIITIQVQQQQFQQTFTSTNQQQWNSSLKDEKIESFVLDLYYYVRQAISSGNLKSVIIISIVLYLFSSWSITISNRNNVSIGLIDLFFILWVIYFIRKWWCSEKITTFVDYLGQNFKNLVSQNNNANDFWNSVNNQCNNNFCGYNRNQDFNGNQNNNQNNSFGNYQANNFPNQNGNNINWNNNQNPNNNQNNQNRNLNNNNYKNQNNQDGINNNQNRSNNNNQDTNNSNNKSGNQINKKSSNRSSYDDRSEKDVNQQYDNYMPDEINYSQQDAEGNQRVDPQQQSQPQNQNRMNQCQNQPNQPNQQQLANPQQGQLETDEQLLHKNKKHNNNDPKQAEPQQEQQNNSQNQQQSQQTGQYPDQRQQEQNRSGNVAQLKSTGPQSNNQQQIQQGQKQSGSRQGNEETQRYLEQAEKDPCLQLTQQQLLDLLLSGKQNSPEQIQQLVNLHLQQKTKNVKLPDDSQQLNKDMCKEIYEYLMEQKKQDPKKLLQQYENAYQQNKQDYNQKLQDSYQNLVNEINKNFDFNFNIGNVAFGTQQKNKNFDNYENNDNNLISNLVQIEGKTLKNMLQQSQPSQQDFYSQREYQFDNEIMKYIQDKNQFQNYQFNNFHQPEYEKYKKLLENYFYEEVTIPQFVVKQDNYHLFDKEEKHNKNKSKQEHQVESLYEPEDLENQNAPSNIELESDPNNNNSQQQPNGNQQQSEQDKLNQKTPGQAQQQPQGSGFQKQTQGNDSQKQLQGVQQQKPKDEQQSKDNRSEETKGVESQQQPSAYKSDQLPQGSEAKRQQQEGDSQKHPSGNESQKQNQQPQDQEQSQKQPKSSKQHQEQECQQQPLELESEPQRNEQQQQSQSNQPQQNPQQLGENQSQKPLLGKESQQQNQGNLQQKPQTGEPQKQTKDNERQKSPTQSKLSQHKFSKQQEEQECQQQPLELETQDQPLEGESQKQGLGQQQLSSGISQQSQNPEFKKTTSVVIKTRPQSDFVEEYQSMKQQFENFYNEKLQADSDYCIQVNEIEQKLDDIMNEILQKQQPDYINKDSLMKFIDDFKQNNLQENQKEISPEIQNLFDDFYNQLGNGNISLEEIPSNVAELLDNYKNQNGLQCSNEISNRLKSNIGVFFDKTNDQFKQQERNNLEKTLQLVKSEILQNNLKTVAIKHPHKLSSLTKSGDSTPSQDKSSPQPEKVQQEEEEKKTNAGGSRFLKQIKMSLVRKFLDTKEEVIKQKTTSEEIAFSIIEKSVRPLAEVFYDNLRNKTYFSQQEMINELKKKYGDDILNLENIDEDLKKAIKQYFQVQFDNAEKEFLDDEINKQLQQSKDKSKINILDVVDNNFTVLKERLNKLKDTTDIQQVQITDEAVFEQANNKLNEIIKGILTDLDQPFNKQLLELKKQLIKYKKPALTASLARKQSASMNTPTNKDENHQIFKEKVENIIKYITDNIDNIKKDLKEYLKQDMKKSLRSKIAQWKLSQQEKMQRMNDKNLDSKNMWFTLIWHDANDLDLNVRCPCGKHIYYGTKKCDNCGTFLQLDMNAGKNQDDTEPIEHIYLQKPAQIGSKWEVYCRLFTSRNGLDSPFTLQIEHEDGRITSFQGTVNDQKKESIHYIYTVSDVLDEKHRNLGLKIRDIIEQF